MTADFDDLWNAAMAGYKAALVEFDRAASEPVCALEAAGNAPIDITVSKKESARATVVDAREALFHLLREHQAKRR